MKPNSLTSLLAEADIYAKAARSISTHRARGYDWKLFTEWCAKMGVSSLPATTEAATAFLVDQSKSRTVSTLTRYRWSISGTHKENGYASPFAGAKIHNVFEGIKRTKGVAQRGRDALDYDVVANAKSGTTKADLRDRALVLFGFMTALRGIELCALDIEDLTFTEKGVLVAVRKSKDDQYREGRTVSVPRAKTKRTCPVVALEKWLAVIPKHGPVFRGVRANGEPGDERISRGTVWSVVKKVADKAGLKGEYGSHSLRVGYVTRARKNGVGWEAIRAQTGHVGEVAKRYSRHVQDPFEESQSAFVLKAKGARKN
jgi:integrase